MVEARAQAAPSPKAEPRAEGSRGVRVDSVTKRFGQVTALDDVSIDFGPGGFNVLLGLSGSGKSTLLRHMNGLHRPTSGTVTTLGVEVSRASGSELRNVRRRVGMIHQHFNLVGRASVLENVCTGRLGSLGWPRPYLWTYPTSVREAAMGHLARVGLADKAFQRADTLSGGQQQRVGIARALMQDPEVLLADEPVASLDPVSSDGVMNLLGSVSSDLGLTMICSLHQVDLALKFADRIIGLRAGRVVMDERADAIGRGDVGRIYEEVAPTLTAVGEASESSAARTP